jgi:hypothetical protein
MMPCLTLSWVAVSSLGEDLGLFLDPVVNGLAAGEKTEAGGEQKGAEQAVVHGDGVTART